MYDPCCVFCLAPVPPSPASLPRWLRGSLSLSAACQLRLDSKEGDTAQLPDSSGPLKERLHIWVQSSPLWQQLVWEGEQHPAPQRPWDRWESFDLGSFVLLPCLENNSKLDCFHTVPSASPLAVSIRVSHEQNNTIYLSWEPPPHDTHNGIIQGYQVITGEQFLTLRCTVLSPPHQSGNYCRFFKLHLETFRLMIQ